MKIKQLVYASLILICGCNNTAPSELTLYPSLNVDIANEFIDAFYSFNEDKLESILSHAEESQPSILYYQKWAECGNYEIIDLPDCIVRNDSLIICPVTVKDDLIGALDIDFNVTDTFRLTIIDGQIRSVVSSSNDPDIYYAAKDWIRKNRPELIEIPCEGIWEGGPSPCDCVRAMVKGFAEFRTNEYPSS